MIPPDEQMPPTNPSSERMCPPFYNSDQHKRRRQSLKDVVYIPWDGFRC